MRKQYIAGKNLAHPELMVNTLSNAYFISEIYTSKNKTKSRFKNLTLPIQLDMNCRNISKIISYFTPQFLIVDLLVGCFKWLSLLSNPQ